VLRTVPPLAWLPLFGVSTIQPQQFFVILLQQLGNHYQHYGGVQQIPRITGTSPKCCDCLSRSFKILIPSAVPYIFTGLRIGIGLSWLAIVAAEMLTGGVGIGFIWDAYNSSRLSEIILALIYVGLVGLLDRLVGFIASKVVPEEQKLGVRDYPTLLPTPYS